MTKSTGRWNRCISHQGRKGWSFLRELFVQDDRHVLLVAGAGFDPRACRVAECLKDVAQNRTRAVFLREERPDPDAALKRLADVNAEQLSTYFAKHRVEFLQIFDRDGAVIGGRRVTSMFVQENFADITDVVVDLSAISVGVSFPLVRMLLERFGTGKKPNIHAVVTNRPDIDDRIQAVPSDRVAPVHGFGGNLGLDTSRNATRMWLPVLSEGRREILSRIHRHLQQQRQEPDDVCPILPFPAISPRTGDGLIEYFGDLFDDEWEVDPRDLIYAHQNDPVDLYRSVVRIYDARSIIFRDLGGSILILSPTGSKALALGMLMAATELDLPVYYLEAAGYEFVDSPAVEASDEVEISHVWLSGEAYASNDAVQPAEGH